MALPAPVFIFTIGFWCVLVTGDQLNLVCCACGGVFNSPKPRSGRYPGFCSPGCRRSHHLAQLKSYRAEGRYATTTRTAPANRRPIAKICEVCKRPFETTNRATICCGITCGQALASVRRSAARTAKSVAARQRTCENCGSPFVAHHPSGAAIAGKVREGRFCSRRCAGAFRARRADQDELRLGGVS